LINNKYHLESLHPEEDSLSANGEGNSQNTELPKTQDYADASDEGLDFFECPRDGCGEAILLSELTSHIGMHDIEGNETEEDSKFENPHLSKKVRSSKLELGFNATLPQALHNLTGEGPSAMSSLSNLQASAKLGWREILNMPALKGSPEKRTVPKKAYRRLGVCTSYTPMILFSYY
jgi:hypothetical protein